MDRCRSSVNKRKSAAPAVVAFTNAAVSAADAALSISPNLSNSVRAKNPVVVASATASLALSPWAANQAGSGVRRIGCGGGGYSRPVKLYGRYSSRCG